MLKGKNDESILKKPLRLWPGVVIVVIQWLANFVLPNLVADSAVYGMMLGVFGGGLAIVVWWLFFSRAPWSDRLGAVALMAVGIFATQYFLHESIATGAMGMIYIILVIPTLSLAFVVWAVVTRHFSVGVRRLSMVATILLACAVWALVKTGGFTSGDIDNDLSWRWADTPEDKLLEKVADEPMALPSAMALEKSGTGWPGYLGPNRDAIIRDVHIETDWSVSPPVELWRRRVGPGWSSFAVRGNLLYTQEQRGDDEVVACYKLSTGEPVWIHGDKARFWESNGGPGPRGTPTFSGGRIYTFGGTGIVNALEAHEGTVVWSRNAANDTGAKLPFWGFASSPLVVDDLVIIHSSGALIAYDIATGEPRWSHPDSSVSYSSPHLVTIEGVTQVLALSERGLTSVIPADGKQLWEHRWSGYPILQPVMTGDGDVLISVTEQSGIRRIAVTHGPNGWNVEERWTSTGLKPYYSGFVVHDGHAFGFDGSILACIDLDDGTRKWKGGRYGAGQLLLLADQSVLVVLSEKGEVALVKAAPDKFTELARFPAIESKTWNHPVLTGDILLVRNGQEMAAFRLSLTSIPHQDSRMRP